MHAIKNMNNGKVVGPDEVFSKTIKLIEEEVLQLGNYEKDFDRIQH